MWVFLIASTFLFKWTDEKGNLHVTDRLASVPAKYRAQFQKAAEEAEKKKKASPPPAEPTPAPDTSAYKRYLERMALERATREKAARIREKLVEARKKAASLEEEYGTLASNPVMNAAVPARRERMETIQDEMSKENAKAETSLNELRDMIVEGLPEAWVTEE